MSEKHYCGDIGEVEYIRLKQPRISKETYYSKEYVQKLRLEIEKLKKIIPKNPKYKYRQFVYGIFSNTDIFKGQIDAYDYFAQKYLVFFGEDVGNEWFCESQLFKTKKEAQEKIKEKENERI